MKKIKLFGDLTAFKADWELHVKTPSEALRAIEANRPGFLIACNQGDYVALLVDETDPENTRQVTLDNAVTAWGDETLMILPSAGGNEPISLTAMFMAIGFTASAAAIAVPIATIVLTMAISLTVSAIASVITGSGGKSMSAGETESYQNSPSFVSNGAVNLLRAGNPYPLLVGHVQDAGSIVLSSNYWVEDIAL
ncbi:hypothetical protein [Methylobacter sp. S3L5C]|uniref:hypothetical protein n=1 Tax=Methylobacter sp. S3L5C TaxID=2839024 RepID=UPI001FABCBE8|nr:hypothetical protein [Methylobacter sp. S3L5C]UOA08319.1 hypothetical protein KKZ03_19285 [Methylobacter sp. S3L5C]